MVIVTEDNLLIDCRSETAEDGATKSSSICHLDRRKDILKMFGLHATEYFS
jgi:hypothetical protein